MTLKDDKLRVLIGCEFSGVVREAFRKRGHDAWSCDLLESEDNSPFHLQCDLLSILNDNWDLAIFHPPCTYLCSRSVYHCRRRKDEYKHDEAQAFFMSLYNADIPKIAVENPVGIMTKRFRKPDQYIDPYYFGEPYRKKTGLWLKNLPLLKPTNMLAPPEPIYISKDGKKRYFVDGMRGGDRAKNRSKTFQGIADAFASQWG